MKADSNSNNMNALVAQLDRVTGYEPVGRGFESLQARQAKKDITKCDVFFCCLRRDKSSILPPFQKS